MAVGKSNGVHKVDEWRDLEGDFEWWQEERRFRGIVMKQTCEMEGYLMAFNPESGRSRVGGSANSGVWSRCALEHVAHAESGVEPMCSCRVHN